MNHLMGRRALLRGVAAAGVPLLCEQCLASGLDSETTAHRAVAQEVSAYSFGQRVWVRVADRSFTCYRAEPTQKYPYFYPILGPVTGLPMTEEAGSPYPHHRSLFLACDRVNGANFWQEGVERGQIVSAGPVVKDTGETPVPHRAGEMPVPHRAGETPLPHRAGEMPVPHRAGETPVPHRTGGMPVPQTRMVISDRCVWRQPGADPVLEDERRFTISAPSQDTRIIDAEIKLSARVDVHVTKTNHSLFAVRAAPALTPSAGGMLVNAHGDRGEKGTFGKPATWCGFQGERLGHTEAIMLMDHPENPWSPCRWFTRDYGFMSPTPFNWLDDKGWNLPQGRSIRLRYRTVIIGRPIAAGEMNRLFDAFTSI